jgi:transcriptional regulator with XRE-family HTH domain
MSEATGRLLVPEWDLADRMRKSLRESGIGVQEMADYLGVARNTVSTWINGKITPSTQTMRLWSLRCGVPYEWLSSGLVSRTEGGPGGSSVIACSVITAGERAARMAMHPRFDELAMAA